MSTRKRTAHGHQEHTVVWLIVVDDEFVGVRLTTGFGLSHVRSEVRLANQLTLRKDVEI